MIAPTYQRAQLWQPARSRLHTTLLAAAIGAACFVALVLPWRGPDHRPTRAAITGQRMVQALARARGCPARLGDVMAVPLDGWGHAFTYRCAGRHLAIGSAGEDGVFATADDLWSRR